MADKTGYIGRNPNESNSAIVRQTYSLTSNTTELSFTAGYIVGFVDVYVNGVKLIDVQDYSATNASTITLTTAAVSGDVVEVVAYKALNVGNVETANGNFSVAGNTTLSGTVSVASTATLSGVVTTGGDLYVGGDLYGDGSNLTGIANTAYIDAASITSSGIVSFTNTTASTSSATGALIVSGGVGIAGSLHVGENVSVGGTLTYEDVTNIDSVGLITARTGIKVLAGGANIVGVSTATLGVDVTAGGVDITAGGLNVDAGIGTFDAGIAVGSGATVSSPSANILTLGTSDKERMRFQTDGRINIETALGLTNKPLVEIYNKDGSVMTGQCLKLRSNRGSGVVDQAIFAIHNDDDDEFFRVQNNGAVGIGTTFATTQLQIQDSSEPTISLWTGGTKRAALQAQSGGTYHYSYQNKPMLFSVASGTSYSEKVRITSTGALHLTNGELLERCHIQSSPAWSSNGAVDLDNGVVQYNTTNYGSGGAGSLYFTSSVGINTQMATGDIMSLTMMTNVNSTAGYINNIFIDGAAATETWVGGSAPTAGGGSGIDIYTFNIIKTASATYTVIANQVKTSA